MDGGEANFGQGERLLYTYVGTSTFLRGCTMGYERRVLWATYEKLALPSRAGTSELIRYRPSPGKSQVYLVLLKFSFKKTIM